MLHSLFELANVNRSILPLVLTISTRLAIKVLPDVGITICEHICSLAVLKTEFPFTFVSVAVLPLVHAEAIRLALSPLANVRVAKDTLPNPLPFLQSVFPFSLVNFPIDPGVDPLAMWLVVLKFTLVAIPIAVSLHTSSVSIIT